MSTTNITKINTRKGQWGTPTITTIAEVADKMRSNALLSLTQRMERRTRAARVSGDEKDVSRLQRTANQLPYLIFSSVFSRKGLHDLQQPTGLLLLSIDTGGDSAKLRRIGQAVRQLPQTLLAFTGSSRRTIKVVVRCRPAEGVLPTTVDGYLAFLCRAQQQVARYYAVCCRCEIPLVEESLRRGCRLCCDPDVYLNELSEPITVIDAGSTATSKVNDFHDCTPTAQDTERERADFMACLKRLSADDTTERRGPIGDEREVRQLARLCRQSALPEEASVQRACIYGPWDMDEATVRSIFRTVYRKHHEGRPHNLMSQQELVARAVQDFFDRRYELRYNIMKRVEEFRPKGRDYAEWRTLTERDLKRITHEQMIDSGMAWAMDLERYVHSSIVADYNPITCYLSSVGTWKGKKDHIGLLARRIPTAFKEWESLFHRWFLGMVAQWMGVSRDYGNAVVPMLIGRQGTRKSTFCKLLLPPELRDYYMDDIKLTSAEQAERVLGRMALVNIDEYNAKTDREQAKIKRLLTEHQVQTRQMRSEQYTLIRRMSSFVATTNDRQPLTDHTGSRRFLCVEVTDTIDTETSLDYNQLYAQAVWEIRNGHPYYLSSVEEKIMESHNRKFLRCSAADIILNTYYKPAPREKQFFLRTIDILEKLHTHASRTDRPNMRQLLAALKNGNYEYGAMKGVRGWYAEKRDGTKKGAPLP